MSLSSQYDALIFDCDGVIFDSNRPKLEAMRTALSNLGYAATEVQNCIDYFQNNFGKPRFYQVKQFFNQFLSCSDSARATEEEKVLATYSQACLNLFDGVTMSPGIEHIFSHFTGDLYVASGSVQDELKSVLALRKIDHYFKGIYGSPTPKGVIVERITQQYPNSRLVLFGDAHADFQAAKDNNIDFIYYRPYSMVKERMTELAAQHHFRVIDHYRELEV